MTNIIQCSFLVFFSICLLHVNCEPEIVDVHCPDYCECDIYEGLNRAFCQDGTLITLELDIPSGVEVLDVSYNLVSAMDDKIFVKTGLTRLKLLNISHNKLSGIHLHGFEGLSDLKTLDLSYNAIEYFLDPWFYDLSSLEELYLRGNKLKSINKQPLISINTLNVLDISYCQINHLNGNIFSNIPNLEYLDISDNVIKYIRVETIKPLKSLVEFKVDNNPVDCKDRSFSILKKYTKEKNIKYMDPCTIQNIETPFQVNNIPIKFQKMVMSESFETTSQSSIEKNKWLSEKRYDVQITCGCNSSDIANNTDVAAKSLFRQAIESWPWLVISVAVFYGMFTGVFLVCALNLCLIKRRQSVRIIEPDAETSDFMYVSVPTENNSEQPLDGTASSFVFNKLKDTFKTSRISSAWSEDGNELMMNEFIPNSTPMQIRRNI